MSFNFFFFFFFFFKKKRLAFSKQSYKKQPVVLDLQSLFKDFVTKVISLLVKLTVITVESIKKYSVEIVISM